MTRQRGERSLERRLISTAALSAMLSRRESARCPFVGLSSVHTLGGHPIERDEALELAYGPLCEASIEHEPME